MNKRVVTLCLLLASLGFGACTARADRPLYLYSYMGSVYTPGHTIPARFVSNVSGDRHIQVFVYRLPELVAWRLGGGQSVPDGYMSVDGLDLVATFQPSGTDPRRSDLHVGTIPALPIGYYLVDASVPGIRQQSIINVTTLGIVTNVVRDVHTLYAVDLRTFQAYPEPLIGEVHNGSTVRRLVFDGAIATDAIPVGAQSKTYAVVIAPDGSRMGVDLNAAYQRGEVGFVQTDRPIYRPGQTIDVRAIVRTGSIGAYAVPIGTRRIVVTSPDQTIIYDHDTRISAFGTVNATIRLPDDARTGSYWIRVGDDLNGYAVVAAYKKPEYTIDFSSDTKYVIGGDSARFTINAKYFFGRPAAGFHLHYVATREPAWIRQGPYDGFGDSQDKLDPSTVVAQGDLTTGAAGTDAIVLPTDRTDTARTVDVVLDGRDASGRTISTRASIEVEPASFFIRLTPAAWFAEQGVATTITLNTIDYDQKVRSSVPVTVKITGWRWDRDAKKSVSFSQETRTVTTDASGTASISWTPAAAGSYTFEAQALDERGYHARGDLYVWAVGSDERYFFSPMQQPTIIAQKPKFALGERPRILITLPEPDRDVLLLVTTDRLISTRLLHVTGQTATVDVDAPKDASAFFVTVEMPNESGVSTGQQRIEMDPGPKTLRVSVTSAKKRYAPGETARFNVLALDAHGKPVRAEFGIGVVDEALYAVQAASTQTPGNVLYDYAVQPTYPEYSWYAPNEAVAPHAELVRAGTASDVYTVNSGTLNTIAAVRSAAGSGPQIRTNFQDTAFWSPSVVTDVNGKANISFVWPDNLTTWRASAVGITKNTDVGQADGDALVTKDFLVRLETPRFLRAGDRSQVIAIAQGQAKRPNVTMKLESTPSNFAAEQIATLTLDANQGASVSWPVVAPGVGNVLLTLSGSDGTLDDAMQANLPLEAATAPEHVRSAGQLPNGSSVEVDVPAGYVGGDVHLTLAPSIVAELVQNVRLLQVYPYYCTEQTVSTSLPALFIDRILKQGGLRQPPDVDTHQIVVNAISRLSELQHNDGSWGWWEYDSAHPFMTAYAVYALAEFKADGYNLPPGMLENGVQSLAEQLATANGDTLRYWGGGQRGSEWNTRAFMLYALAKAEPEKIDPDILAQTKAHVGNLNPYAIAVLGLTEHLLGDDATARDLARELEKRETNEGAFTFWRGDTWHYAWEDDPIETTAYALRLEVAVNPNSPLIPRVVTFLRAQRQGAWWFTTKDTAAAIYALSEAYKPDPAEFHPNETVDVLVDGKSVRTLHITTPIIDAADASIVVPATQLHDGSTISFRTQGTGALYWSSDAVRYLPPSAQIASDAPRSLLDRLFGVAPELTVHRSYDVGHDGPWRIGDKVHVTLTIVAHSDVQYLAVEDPFPAAAEPQPDQGHAAADAWSGLQLLDDRAVFFADRMYDRVPLVITYDLRVTTAGTYTAPPPTATAMYGPPVSAIGTPTNVEVDP